MRQQKKHLTLSKSDIDDYLARRCNLNSLATKYECSRAIVSRSLKETGRADVIAMIKQNSIKGATKLSDHQIEEILIRAKSGELPIDFAYEYGIDVSAIRYHLRKHGVATKRAERKEWIERKSEVISRGASIAHLIPKNAYTSFHSMMTRAMQA